MSAAQREFDIVLYGATGFVGKLTAEYLAKAGGDARIALAGRSQDKLLAVRDTLPDNAQSWPLLTADASQPSTLDAMAARTQVVVTTVGPYLRYGLPLVAACAAAGTDYADLTGEAIFIRESIDLHHKAGHRHRRAHRAFVRIRFHPFGFHRLRALPARRARPGRSARRHQSRGALIRRRRVGRHRRLDAGAHAHGLYRSRGQAADERPLHAVPRPRRGARTRCAAGCAMASRRRDRA